MHDRWRVGTFPDEVWIVRSYGSAVPGGADVISPENAGWSVGAWFPDDGGGRQTLAEILAQLGGGVLSRPELGTEAMRAQIHEALRSGALRAYRVHVMLSGGAVQVEPEPPSEPEPVHEEKTWIQIELVDEADPPRPVPFKRYRIQLPDESIREGMLDANGQARISEIDPGTCKVSFPQIHADDWQQA